MAFEGLKAYGSASRAPRYSILFALPLFVAYEALVWSTGSAVGGVRNGADVMLQELAYTAVGPRGPLVLMGLIIGVAAAIAWRDLRRHPGGLSGGVFAGMAFESVVLAVVFGTVIGMITAQLLGAMHAMAITSPALAAQAQPGGVTTLPMPTRIMLSLGAGLYEELFFRVLLVGSISGVCRTLLGMGRGIAGVIAVIIGALVFSAFHYVGPYGDPFTIQSFAFRAISGVAFSAMYLLRGFGITAWTHAIYDLLVLVM